MIKAHANQIDHAARTRTHWTAPAGDVDNKLDELGGRTSALISPTAGRLFGTAVGSTVAAFLTAAQSYADLGILRAFKSANEVVNNSSALQDDNHLTLSVVASTSYLLLMGLTWSSNNTPDFQHEFSGPASSVPTIFCYTGYNATATMGSTRITALSTPVTIAGSTGVICGTFGFGTFVTAATAGTLQYRWAQAVANASDTTVYANSFLVLIPLA